MTNLINSNQTFFSEKTKNTSIDYRNYFLVVLIILLEDSPFFTMVHQNFWLVIFILLIIFNGGKKKTINSKIILILIFVWSLIFIQSMIYGGGFTPAAFYKPIWIFYTPFLVFTLMGIKYFKYFFNVIYFIAVYTTFIFLLHTISLPFHDWLMQAFVDVYPYSWSGLDWPRSILIYSLPRDSGYFFMRNSGVFHEPGAYSIYLMLAIIINTFLTKKPLHPKNIFMAIVVLTTFSTTGYIMLFFFFGYSVMILKIHYFLKPLIIVPFVVLLIYIYQETNFLKQKVDVHYTTQLKAVESGEIDRRGRFYAFGMSAKAFASNPITGTGILREHKYDVGKRGSFGYGFAGLFAMYGLFFGLFYMWYFYKGFLKINEIYQMPKYYVPTVFIVINMGLLTQAFFLHIPFVYFFIIGLFYYTPEMKAFKTTV